MKELVSLIGDVRRLDRPAALATLVRVKGSSYRKPGARMLFSAEGTRSGLISAGCLETDVLARVESVLAGAVPQLALYDMGSELDLVWGTGMGCEGKVEVLLERVAPGEAAPWMDLCESLLARRGTGVMGTVFETKGAAPFGPGTRFVLPEGAEGLLPEAGPWRQAFLEEAARAQARGTSAAATLSVDGGEAALLMEPLLPPYALWIYGAGEHGRPLYRLAKALGWYVGIVDHRPALATQERFPEADRVVVGHPPEVFRDLSFDRRSAALVISHVFEQDKAALAALLDAPVGYLGLQGNRRRCARLLEETCADGVENQHLFAPAGLDLGAEGPDAIALSMLAEIQAVLAGYPGGHLRDRAGRIRN